MSPPASWFAIGLVHHIPAHAEDVPGYLPGSTITTTVAASSYVSLSSLRERVVVAYASAAAIVVLVGLAFGAGRRTYREER